MEGWREGGREGWCERDGVRWMEGGRDDAWMQRERESGKDAWVEGGRREIERGRYSALILPTLTSLLPSLLPSRQLGSFYPFMRAHAHLDTRRREPWLYEADKMAAIRQAVRLRYQLLPLWYTLFYEAYRMGLPVIR